MMKPDRSTPALLLAAFALGACADEPAFDFELAADPNVSTEAQLVERIGSVVFVLDSPDGLYAPGEERSEEGFQIKDADSDPNDLELVVSIPIVEGALPTVRIERGGLPDVPIDVRVLGLPISGSGPPVADGLLRGLRFSDAPQPITLPFDLRDELLPPRVEDVIPADGSSIPDCVVPSVIVVFSRPVDEGSLLAPDAVRIEPIGMPVQVSLDEAGLVATIVPTALEGSGPSIAYRVIVESTVEDRDGGPLDQIALEAGAQAFEADYTHMCAPPPQLPAVPCGDIVCPPYERIECIADECVISKCSVDCEGGLVCAPLEDTCVSDCRIGDAISDCVDGLECDLDTGLCH